MDVETRKVTITAADRDHHQPIEVEDHGDYLLSVEGVGAGTGFDSGPVLVGEPYLATRTDDGRVKLTKQVS